MPQTRRRWRRPPQHEREEIERSPGAGAQFERKPERQVAVWGAKLETVNQGDPGTVCEAGSNKAGPDFAPRSPASVAENGRGKRAGRDGYESRHGYVIVPGVSTGNWCPHREMRSFTDVADIGRRAHPRGVPAAELPSHRALECEQARDSPKVAFSATSGRIWTAPPAFVRRFRTRPGRRCQSSLPSISFMTGIAWTAVPSTTSTK